MFSGSTSESSSPYRSGGSSNPFSKKSSVSAAMAAINQQGPPASSPSSENPYAKNGSRASSASAFVHNPRASHSAPAARRGSGSSQGSEDESTKEGSQSARRAESGGVASGTAGGAGNSRVKVFPRLGGPGRHNSPRDVPTEDTEYTPRSNHSGPAKPMRSSASTSALPPTHSRAKSHTRNHSGSNDMDTTTATTSIHSHAHSHASGGSKWKCSNNKCGKWNEADDSFCMHCAFRRGATGERGALARSAEIDVDDESVDEGKWKCMNSRCGKMNMNEDDFCMHCATRKGATGARGTGAVLFAAER